MAGFRKKRQGMGANSGYYGHNDVAEREQQRESKNSYRISTAGMRVHMHGGELRVYQRFGGHFVWPEMCRT